MKAVQFAQYGGPDVLQVREVPDPIPGPSDVLIEVKATTVNRLDLFQRDGSRPVEKLPFTTGSEAAGVVLQDNQGFHAGERVMTTHALAAKGGGGYASKIAVPAANLVRIPDRKSTRLNSSHTVISYAVFCLKKKTQTRKSRRMQDYEKMYS